MSLQDKINEINEKIEVLIGDVKSLTNELDTMVENEFPRVGDTYWYIGKIGTGCWVVWEDSSVDKHLKSIGNVFETEGEAEFAVEKLKIEAELRKHSRPFEEGKNNYFMVFDTNYNSVDILGMSYSRVQGVIYFESEEKVQQAIETVGEDRIKKYIFGWED